MAAGRYLMRLLFRPIRLRLDTKPTAEIRAPEIPISAGEYKWAARTQKIKPKNAAAAAEIIKYAEFRNRLSLLKCETIRGITINIIIL